MDKIKNGWVWLGHIALVVAVVLSLMAVPVTVLFLGPSTVLAAAPTVASVTSSTFTTETTAHNVDMPATVNSGDLLIAFASYRNDRPMTAAPSDWTTLGSLQIQGELGMGVFYKIATGSEGSTTTVDFVTNGNSRMAAQVYRITGWLGTTPPEISNAVKGKSVKPDPGSLTPSWGAEDTTLWIAVAGQEEPGTGASAYPANYTSNQTNTVTGAGNRNFAIYSATRVNAVETEDPDAFTVKTIEIGLPIP